MTLLHNLKVAGRVSYFLLGKPLECVKTKSVLLGRPCVSFFKNSYQDHVRLFSSAGSVVHENVEEKLSLVINEMLSSGVIDEKRSQSSLFQSFVEALIQAKTQKNVIKKHFEYFPDFYKKVTPMELQTVSAVLRNFEFESRDIMNRLPKAVYVFKVSEDHLTNTLVQLKGLGFSSKKVINICLTNPRVLSVPVDLLLSNFSELHKWFSRRDVCMILGNNPQVFTKDKNHIAEIVSYIQDDMGLDIKVAAESYCFRKPLLRLKTRHQFLVRCGLWTSNALKNKALPPFKLVMDSDDRYFCKKLAGMSRAEYEAFTKIMEMEEEEGSDSESDSDEEED